MPSWFSQMWNWRLSKTDSWVLRFYHVLDCWLAFRTPQWFWIREPANRRWDIVRLQPTKQYWDGACTGYCKIAGSNMRGVKDIQIISLEELHCNKISFINILTSSLWPRASALLNLEMLVFGKLPSSELPVACSVWKSLNGDTADCQAEGREE